MVDVFSVSKRSSVMAKIRSSNTRPEILVRSALHRMGYRFRLHSPDLPGTPDIVLPRFKLVLFVHGCFWHRHKGCPFAYMPKSKIEFWEKKFSENVRRDRKVQKSLRSQGWQVEIIWECTLRDMSKLETLLRNKLKAE